jgi:hypothetical protein
MHHAEHTAGTVFERIGGRHWDEMLPVVRSEADVTLVLALEEETLLNQRRRRIV